MKPDSMLVEPQYLFDATCKVEERGWPTVLSELSSVEPALTRFIEDRLAQVAGRLALAGVTRSLIQCNNTEVAKLVLACFEAVRRGHYELWKDVPVSGTEPQKNSFASRVDPGDKPVADSGDDQIPF